MANKKLSLTLFERLRLKLLSFLLGRDRKASDFLADNAKVPGLTREFFRGRRFSAAIDSKKIRRVIFLGMSRSGTHNFTTRFHYLDCAFVFKENSFSDRDAPIRFDRFP